MRRRMHWKILSGLMLVGGIGPLASGADLALVKKILLPGRFNQMRLRGDSHYLLPRIGNHVVEVDSDFQVKSDFVLPGPPFRNLRDFVVANESFFISDGDSIYRYFPRFGRFEAFYPSGRIQAMAASEEGELLVAADLGRRLVLLDNSGREKLVLTRYRPKCLADGARGYWVGEANRLVKLDEFGNEETSHPINSIRRISADGELVAVLHKNGLKLSVVQGDTVARFELDERALDLTIRGRSVFCLGTGGDAVFEYHISPE